MQVRNLVLVVLGAFAAAFLLASGSLAPAQDQQDSAEQENLVFGEENLSFPDEDQSAPAENLTFPADDLTSPDEAPVSANERSDGFGDSRSQKIAVSPVDFPDADFSRAPTEAEPNEDADAASRLGAVSTGTDEPQFAARGTLNGRDTDYYAFSVEGDAQLYLIEAVGPGVNRMTLYESAGRLAYGKGRQDGAGLSIAGAYLAPGDYHVSVEHFRDDGETAYTLRALSLGAPDAHVEREPNDDKALAELLEPGFPRTGLFLEPDDTDHYRFSLAAEQLVRLRIEPPPEIRLYMALYSGTQQLVNRTPDDPGAPIEYTALLQPGDYALNLHPRDGASATPYVVSLELGNRFTSLVDLEPNNEPHQARPVPANGRIQGHARDFGDYDWYRLPVIAAATALTIHDEAQARSVSLVRYADGKTTNEKLEWLRAENAHVGQLQAGARYLLRVAVRGDYAFQLDLAPGPEHESGSRKGEVLAGVTLQVSGEPPAFAAFWHESQRANMPLTVTNNGSGPVRLRTEAATSHPAWTAGIPGEPLLLGPGQSKKVPITLQVAPDAPANMPVRIDFRVVDPHDAQQVASMPALATCGIEPVNPGRIWTLPEALVGGFNVAWSGLGSRVHDAPADSYGARQPWLYDGVTPNDLSWYRVGGSYPLDLTAELAGDGLIPVAGIILDTPQSGGAYGSTVRDFELRLSRDGAVYEKALSATLSQTRIPQHFVLPQPVEARFAQFRILSVHDPRQSRVTLGEIGIVADPAASPFAGRRFNLAEPALGGYVAWSRPDFDLYARAESILTEEVERPSLEVDPVLPTEWVIGFHHNRAAQITELQWVDSPGEAKWPRIGSVQVSISMDGPAGPWETLGAWNLDRAAGPVAPFVLPESRWARFVRFVFTGAESAGRWELAETLRILERGVDDGYRSILAEWGQYASESVHEWMQETSEAGLGAAAHAGENDRRGTALRMNAGVQYTDQVQRGSRVAWYRFDVPQDHNRLRFSLTGNPVADVSATLEDETGADIPLEQVSGTGNELVLETLLQGGSSYWLRVEEPVRHVVVAWDNSGSVRPYRPAIYSAINNFVRDIRPGNEFVHLLPFRTGGFLLSDWSDRTGPLMAGLQSYPRRDDDSNAEEYLLRSSTALGIKHGAKAVVLVTDAETFSYDRTPELWHSLSSVRPRVFAVELHRGDGAAHQQDLMQSWADVNNGFYAHFRQQNDLDIAFDRAFCHLRRPVRFYMTADSRFEEPPGPGLLSVSVENAVSANAVELILDASGSMLQRLEGQRRIEIARTVLTDLINKTIPEGTPLALRVFGHRKPDACDTDLASPLQPLERSKVTGIIQATQAMNLAKTPIGESLRLVADDLRGVDGQKLIILITDGEETCDGDPAAAIASLKESGHDVRVNIVGFAIDDAALKAQFEEWSRIGGGLYFSAGSAAELDEALRQALRPKYQVLDGMGAIVASGTAGAEDVELPSGTYTVKILTSPILTFGDVEIRPEETTRISATGED